MAKIQQRSGVYGDGTYSSGVYAHVATEQELHEEINAKLGMLAPAIEQLKGVFPLEYSQYCEAYNSVLIRMQRQQTRKSLTVILDFVNELGKSLAPYFQR